MSEPVPVAAMLVRVPRPVTALERHQVFRSRRWQRDARLGTAALVAAVLALPLSPSSHSAEIAAVLAIAAVALLAEHRWAVALIVVGELLLFPWLMVRVASPAMTGDAAHLAASGAALAMVPGLLSTRRGAAALVALTGVPRRRARCRLAHGALAACAVVGTVIAL
ncbi:MAG: hypothetical protein R2939_13165 [Kofleriaceae bacterium]